MTLSSFKKTVWKYYRLHGRHDLPWRLTRDPYKILVSEIMLQQTQVSRVIPKYKSFLQKFPTVQKLASAKLSDVLKEWQGLGYNRRGMYLKQTAEEIVANYNGKFPRDLAALKKLPGVGAATAGDIMAFAWNLPAIVIETNIRSVFIHHFLGMDANGVPGIKCSIHDKEIAPIVEKTLDKNNPREWYYALMDYGAHLKQVEKENPSRKSAHYVKQSKFEGSNRQKRSQILKLLLEHPLTKKELWKFTKYDPIIIENNLKALTNEKMIVKKSSKYTVL